MARISGIDLPRQKRVVIALTYIYGVGPAISSQLLAKAKVDESVKVKDLSEDEIVKLRNLIRELLVEGDLRRQRAQDVKRLAEIGSFRGNRHKRKLPCRGQRTHTNARTKRGKKIAIAGKKKATK